MSTQPLQGVRRKEDLVFLGSSAGDGRQVEEEQRLIVGPSRTRRVLLMIASIGLFGPALIAWGSIIQLPLVGVLSTVGFAVALVLAILALTCRSEAVLGRLDWTVLLLGIVVLATWAGTELYFFPAYGTDESAFVQGAAQKLLHGHNPYTSNLLPSLAHYRVPIQYATYTLDGGIVSHLAYPALSFLLVVPAVLVTHGVQSVIAENVFFLALELLLVFLFLPRAYRALSVVVVLGLSFLFDYTFGGDIVTLSIPFMLIVAYKWTDIGAGGRLDRRNKIQAVCLGLAVSISQITWFVAPFLVVGLLRLRTRQLGGRTGSAIVYRFMLIAGGAALLINAPFIAWAPVAWTKGILSPVLQHAIPFGQGLIDATAFFGIGGGNLAYYSYAAVCCLVALLALYSSYFDRLWRVGFMLPSLVFLFSTRSLSEYVIMVVAIWVVSALAPGTGPGWDSDGSVRRQPDPWLAEGARRWYYLERVLIVAAGLTGIACIALALTTPAPLKIQITSVQTNGQFRSIWRIRTLVLNKSHAKVEPHFATDASGYMTTFWNVVRGPRSLAPGQRAEYTLVAPNVGSMPGVTQPFVLQAVTASPQTISSSRLFTPEHFDTFISPSYVNHVLPLGRTVTLKVELRSPYGAPVRQSGIHVALGQIIYGQNTLIPGEAEINGSPEGQSPVITKTNAAGIAAFRIRERTGQAGNPLYFQSYVQPPRHFPYGYSEVVSVQWLPKGETR